MNKEPYEIARLPHILDEESNRLTPVDSRGLCINREPAARPPREDYELCCEFLQQAKSDGFLEGEPMDVCEVASALGPILNRRGGVSVGAVILAAREVHCDLHFRTGGLQPEICVNKKWLTRIEREAKQIFRR